jgi:hypothetical protein
MNLLKNFNYGRFVVVNLSLLACLGLLSVSCQKKKKSAAAPATVVAYQQNTKKSSSTKKSTESTTKKIAQAEPEKYTEEKIEKKSHHHYAKSNNELEAITTAELAPLRNPYKNIILIQSKTQPTVILAGYGGEIPIKIKQPNTYRQMIKANPYCYGVRSAASDVDTYNKSTMLAAQANDDAEMHLKSADAIMASRRVHADFFSQSNLAANIQFSVRLSGLNEAVEVLAQLNPEYQFQTVQVKGFAMRVKTNGELQQYVDEWQRDSRELTLEEVNSENLPLGAVAACAVFVPRAFDTASYNPSKDNYNETKLVLIPILDL